jgi:predicted DNA-binding transcriptional regulator AlpA
VEAIENIQVVTTRPAIVETAVYSIKEAIETTGFSRATFYRAERDGKLRVRTQGRRRYLLGNDLLAWLQAE